MDILIALLVLACALAHAAWNILIKMGGDRLSATALLFFYTGVVSVPVIFVTPLPPSGVWVYLLPSAAIHAIYIYYLSKAYEIGDFSRIYPIARGAAPLLSIFGAVLFLNETLSSTQTGAVSCITLGVLALSINRQTGKTLKIDASALLALFIASLIGVYTLLDGAGARVYGNAFAYIAWNFILFGFPFALYVLLKRRHTFVTLLQKQSHKAAPAALITATAYMGVT